jgi:mannose-6-phosphate isomerase-like protein (cupin superfamily)
MPNVTIKHIDELEQFRGEGSVPSVRMLQAAKTLGISAWGMRIIKLDPNCNDYFEHDHKHDGQEEVYIILKGKAKLITGEEESELEPMMMVRVGPDQKRKFVTGPEDGATILAIGATPGKPYKPAVL